MRERISCKHCGGNNTILTSVNTKLNQYSFKCLDCKQATSINKIKKCKGSFLSLLSSGGESICSV